MKLSRLLHQRGYFPTVPSGEKKAKPKKDKDDRSIDVCLHCEKKSCTGYCKKIKRGKQK